MPWIAVARDEEVTEGSWKIVQLAGRQVGLTRRGETCFAVLNFCPHAGAPVCRGLVTGRVTCDAHGHVDYDAHALTLRCPWHRWEFDLVTGAPVTQIRQRLKTYPVRIAGGQVEVEA